MVQHVEKTLFPYYYDQQSTLNIPVNQRWSNSIEATLFEQEQGNNSGQATYWVKGGGVYEIFELTSILGTMCAHHTASATLLQTIQLFKKR